MINLSDSPVWLCDVSMPYVTFYGGRKQAWQNFSFSFWTWMAVLGIQTLKSLPTQGAKKIIFTARHSGKLKLAFTSPDIINFGLAPKAFWWAELISQFFLYSNCSKNIACPLGKLKTEFTSPIAKSTSPRLSDTTFFARCYIWQN